MLNISTYYYYVGMYHETSGISVKLPLRLHIHGGNLWVILQFCCTAAAVITGQTTTTPNLPPQGGLLSP
jgi:hypothetical protein